LWQTDLAKRYDVDRVTIYRWEQANRLPAPDVIVGRRRGRYETTMLAFDRATTQAE
jgi:predicted site-specific integrase-resolvase